MPAEAQTKVEAQSEAEAKMVDLPSDGPSVDVEVDPTKEKKVNPESQESEVVVEEKQDTASTEEMDDYGKKVQTRIDRLTKKLREAERREQAAVQYAQGVQEQAKTLQSRVGNLDRGYVLEYGNRVKAETEDAKKRLKEAMDAGEASDEQKEQARELYNKIMQKAGEIGLADEIDDFMKMHIDSMEKGDPKLGFGRTDIDESLWANIHKKRQRIKRGSGEKMRKKGEKGAPTPAQMKRAKSEQMLEYVEKVLKKDKKLPNLMIPKKGKAGTTKYSRSKAMRRTDKFSDYQMMMKNSWGEVTEASEYQGKKVELNNPTRGDVKKYKVYVKNDKGNVVKVEFGDPNMEIKRDDPARRKSFRARHNCDNPGPKYKARYWSCKFWSAKSVTDLMKG